MKSALKVVSVPWLTLENPKNLNGTMVRFIETGITMNFQTAAMVHAWLGEQLGQMQAIMKAQQGFMEGGAAEAAQEG